MITDIELKVLVNKFSDLRKKYPDLIGEVTKRDLEKIINYLFEPGSSEMYVWQMISRVNVFSYAAFIHEIVELEYLEELKERRLIESWEDAKKKDKKFGYIRTAYGKALYEQYKIIREYIFFVAGKTYNLTQLCYCDVWEDNEEWDKYDTRKLKKYLKNYEKEWYIKNNERSWIQDDELKSLLKKNREISWR